MLCSIFSVSTHYHMKNIFTFLLVSFIGLNTIAQNDWKYETTKNDIKIYTGPKEGSKHKQCKAIVEINTTIDEFCRYITNPDNYKTHSSRIKMLKTLKKGTNSAYYYLAVDVPMFSDRDGVYYVEQKSKSDTKAKVEIKAKPDLTEDQKGFVRVKISHTIYNVEKTDKGIKMTMFMHADPGGSVPGWVANMFLVDSPLEICAAIRNDLETKNY